MKKVCASGISRMPIKKSARRRESFRKCMHVYILECANLITASINIAKGYSALSRWISCPMLSHLIVKSILVAGACAAAYRSNSSALVKNFGYIGTRFRKRIQRSKIRESLPLLSPPSLLINFAESLSRLTPGLFVRRRRDLLSEYPTDSIRALDNRVSSNLHFKQRQL